ncbi:ABC transporter ATP-binding protein [Leuconostocaceae bacterium ESL0723]|nr:ABC transporter ATP-binding protein [Leuconostocaceae bacterium ESL0723]
MTIQIQDIKKSFGNQPVLRGVSLSLADDQFIGILGPNGAGKSTLVKIMTGQLTPSAGQVRWYGQSNQPLTAAQRAQRMGIVHQNSVLDGFLTVEENLITRGAIKNLSPAITRQRIQDLNGTIELNSLLKQRYQNLSGGQKRRVDIAAALLHNPQVLILDEPTTGIDPEIRAELWTAIHQLRQERHLGVILITHYLEEMQDVDSLVVLLAGQVRYQGNLANFIQDHAHSQLELVVKTPDGGEHTITKPYADLAEKMQVLNDSYSSGSLIDFHDEPVSLEQAYLNMLRAVQRQSKEAGPGSPEPKAVKPDDTATTRLKKFNH